jgi:hypothetical protein
MGYHKRKITKGIYGELSKVQEELEECYDAQEQENRIMLAVEVSDLIGAIEGYIKKHFPTLTIDDFLKMSAATRRAFQDGERS